MISNNLTMKKKLIHKLLDLPLLAIQMLSAFPVIGKGKHLVCFYLLKITDLPFNIFFDL